MNDTDPASAVLEERTLETPWIKDYDEAAGEGPTRWAKRGDVFHWGILAAYVDGRRVGGCVLAHKTDGVNKLEGRGDLVAMWDLRIHPDLRGKGIGSGLFTAAAAWARKRRCRELKVETQNINVPACRFYMRQGCRLDAINRHVYEDFPDEVELIWCLGL
jgi:GNAT superfamily N-acetyltransferase